MNVKTGQNNFFKRLIKSAIRIGIRGGIILFYEWVSNSLNYYYCKIFKSSKTFTFQGEIYSYLYHKYNMSWKNERTVEIPIVWKMLEKYNSQNILEVGNVLSHYFPVKHNILDKYEKGERIINQDIADFQSSEKSDLIVSISTLEHIGCWDKEQYEPQKIMQALENLKTVLSQGGKMIVTLPVGYNLYLDKLIKEGKIQFTEMYCLKRISAGNEWIEADWSDVQNIKYNTPFPSANGLIIGIIEKV